MYFEGQIQTASEEVHRLVCFSPEKQHKFLNAQASKKPVNLTNANLSPSASGEVDVLVNKHYLSRNGLPTCAFQIRSQDTQQTRSHKPRG